MRECRGRDVKRTVGEQQVRGFLSTLEIHFQSIVGNLSTVTKKEEGKRKPLTACGNVEIPTRGRRSRITQRCRFFLSSCHFSILGSHPPPTSSSCSSLQMVCKLEDDDIGGETPIAANERYAPNLNPKRGNKQRQQNAKTAIAFKRRQTLPFRHSIRAILQLHSVHSFSRFHLGFNF